MQNYQITRHDRCGAIIGTVSVLVPDDDFARLSAKTMLEPGITVEVWQDSRFVGALPQPVRPQSDVLRHQRFTDLTPRLPHR